MPTIPDPQPGYKPAREEKPPDPSGGIRHAADPASAPAIVDSPRKTRLLATTILAAMALAAVLLAFTNPVDVLGGGGCPTRRFAGVYCPGCGSLRATHQLLQGHAALAWRHNPLLVVVGLPCAAWLALSYGVALITGRPGRSILTKHPPAWLLWSAAALLIGWGVVRNIPLAALDWTRPPAAAGEVAPPPTPA